MKHKATILFFFCAFLLTATLKGQGNLVIVGGALDRSNHEVYHKFIELAGGPSQAIISIIPAASGSPASSGKSFKQNLMEYGVSEENIFIIPIAVLDCSSTPDTDESLWKDGAEDPDVVATISRSSGIWFTGGDQSRITATFRRVDGSETPALQSMREVWQNGAVIGGTSAGAAMMSSVMITGGVSMASLKYGVTDEYISSEQQDNGPLTLSQGLGFFTHGIIDQHFDKKNRLGRLIVAVYANKSKYPVGFGIDENTALVYYGETQTIEAMGEGGVTIVDIRKAISKEKKKTTSYQHAVISFLEHNDTYCIISEEFSINPVKKPTTGNEYYSISISVQSGIFSSYSTTYKDLISYHLIDNKANDKVVTLCFDDSNTAFRVTFSKTPETRGYWTNSLNGRDSYSFIRVQADIEPVKVNFKKIH